MSRTGIGYDSHRYGEGRPLILGGQRIPHSLGLIGHSDADAVAHAVTDAVLGAAVTATSCDLFITIGTSAVVYPAAGLLQDARRAGAVTGHEDHRSHASCLWHAAQAQLPLRLRIFGLLGR